MNDTAHSTIGTRIDIRDLSFYYGDTQALKSAISRLRAIDSVFDAYRVIPAGG